MEGWVSGERWDGGGEAEKTGSEYRFFEARKG